MVGVGVGRAGLWWAGAGGSLGGPAGRLPAVRLLTAGTVGRNKHTWQRRGGCGLRPPVPTPATKNKQ